MQKQDIDKLKIAIQEIELKQNIIYLIDRFLSNMEDSKVLDLCSQWGSAPTSSVLSNFNDIKISRYSVYNLIGKEIEELLKRKLVMLRREIEDVNVEDLMR